MSANLKRATQGTSNQKKSHALALVDSTTEKKPGKRDALEPYRKQAEKYVRLYFSASTPDFLRDLLSSWFTRMEDEFQIVYNERSVLEVVLPLWLQEADRQGINVESSKSSISRAAYSESLDLASLAQERYVHEPTEREILYREIQADAEALIRILKSPRVPEHIKSDLWERFNETTDAHMSEPESLRGKYIPAALKYCTESPEGSGTD